VASVDLSKKIEEGLNDGEAWKGRQRAFGFIRPGMQRMVKRYPELTHQLRAVKEYSVNHMDELLEQATKSLEAKGVQVFVAKTEEEAKAYIENVVGKSLVVKSKTNAGKEIGITNHLIQKGAKVIETDLGDRLVQLEGKDKSTHTLAPAIHIPIEDVTTLLSDNVGRELECDLKTLVRAARESLREYLTTADVGISGANAIDAETGSIFLTENEGNIRCVTSIPRVHIAIAGVEKIVPRLTDGLTVVKAAAAYGVGQDIGTYISVIDGVSQYNNDELAFLGSGQGPEEVHVVFLTQGRQKAINEGFSEALYCINCGSCLNFCPVYAEIGQNYGYKYLGGRGAVFSAFHGNGLDKAQEAGLSLCIGCKRCEEACAVGMHTPEMISELRSKVAKEDGLGTAKQSVFKVLGSNKLAPLMKLARNVQGLGLKRTAGGATARINLGKMGIPSDRLLPSLAHQSFAEQIAKKSPLAKPAAKVAFFAGCLVNYATPQLGMDVYDILAANNIQMVTYEKEACCGLPAIMSGDTEDALKLAKTNIGLFSSDEYEHIVFACPSCATTVKQEWEELLKQEHDPKLLAAYQKVQSKVIDLNDYLVNVLQVTMPKLKEPVTVTYHDSCHMARGLKVTAEPRKLLQDAGVELKEMEDAASCCGFGGSFSLFYYELSKRVNDAKIKKAQAIEADYIVASCPGCVMHLKDGVNRADGKQNVVHVAQILAAAYRGGKIK
jgi:iron-sulfur cluster protein